MTITIPIAITSTVTLTTTVHTSGRSLASTVKAQIELLREKPFHKVAEVPIVRR